MGKQTRRSMLKSAAVAASVATLAGADAVAQKPGAPEKKSYGYGANRKPGEGPPLFNAAVSYGNLLFLAGVGYHKPGTIQEATKAVLDEIEQNLKSAGSSMDKVLKVSVFLNDLKDYAGMNGEPKRQGAALAVLAYFFDNCDIFEDPVASAVAS